MPETDTSPSPPADAPKGYQRLTGAGGPWFQSLGPIYTRRTGACVVLALRLNERHLNIQGVAHGGMLTTLADNALGMNVALARGIRGAQVTVSLSADFLSSARAGDWVEAHTEITRLGRRMAFANCNLKVGDKVVLRTSAVFAFVERTLPPSVPDIKDFPIADG
jgi:uncharacterized protein (TIGR00369 family)